ncbi:acetyltransferase [Eubacterium sp.]|uniref:acetyltransferase n=1 Tax=Eubacterium sp. TaxID=142586 RepID=UPI0025E49D29|nr:acetyltransferase [Eubacterium sp.]MCR5629806.1 acetyltransferase [Eubacterium sp.]
MKKLVIIGASGHGKVVADIAKLNGYDEIIFLDNNPNIKECCGFPVMGPDSLSSEIDGDIFIAVGNAQIRKMLMNKNIGRKFPVLVHPSAVIAESVTISEGTVIMAGAVINPDVCIGKGCIVNTSSSIDHDCVIGDYVHVSVGAHLCGTVNIGQQTWVGAGAIISNNISICDECIIGAGAVVVKDIKEEGTFVGVPARQI